MPKCATTAEQFCNDFHAHPVTCYGYETSGALKAEFSGITQLQALSALILLVSGRKSIWLVKNSVVRCWCGYLSGVKCK